MTLVETLIGVALAGVALLALTALFSIALDAWERASARAETLAAMTNAIDQMTRDVRLAGYDPEERGIAALVTAEQARVELQADLDADGAIDPTSEESIVYRPSAIGTTLLRVVGAQTMPMLSHLDRGGFRLRYFDAEGAEISPDRPDITVATRLITFDVETRIGTEPAMHMAGGARLLNR